MPSKEQRKPPDPQGLIEQIYRTGAAQDTWGKTLRELRILFEGDIAVLARYDYAEKKGALFHSDGLNEDVLEAYNSYFGRLNPWFSCKHMLRLGEVRNGAQLLPDDVYVQTEFYNDWVRPLGVFHTMRGVIHRSNAEILYAAVMRPHSAGQFEPRELSLFKGLIPHFQRAAATYRRFNELRTMTQGMLAALDLLSFGAVILDAESHPLVINEIGQHILKDRDGLSLGPNGLHASLRCEQQHLRRAFERTREKAKGGAMHPVEILVVTRPSGRQPLSLWIHPLSAGDPLFEREAPSLLVVLGDPEREPEADDEALQRIYGLTPTEARLAGCLAKGERLGDAADHLHIARSTARTHLKHVFGKTRTNRQAELVRLLLSRPGVCR